MNWALRTLALVLVLCLAVLAIDSVQAETTNAVLTRTIRVVDPDGKPVANAFMIPWSINEVYFWPDRYMKRTSYKTDANGLAEVKYPQFADYGSIKLLVESIKVSVYHPDFRQEETVVPVGKGTGAKDAGQESEPFEIRVKPGLMLKVSAVDESGKPLTEPFSVAVTGSSLHSRWNRPTPDKAQARSIKPGNHQIMLFQGRTDGRHRFSEVLSYHFDAEKEPEVTIEDIELQPGISLSGRLEDKVPRPVKNGFVLAAHTPLPLGNTYEDQLPSLIYYSSADIREDGTFQFPSMPPTGTVQLIALCEHWVGLKGDGAGIEGQTFEVETNEPLVLKSSTPSMPRFVSWTKRADPWMVLRS